MNVYYQASDGSIRSLGDNELAHYNHNHDALGRFAGSGSGARSYQKKLRKAEVARVKAVGREMRADYKFAKAVGKAARKTPVLDKPSDVSDKNATKVAKAHDKYTRAVSERKQATANTNKILNEAYNKGYKVGGYYTMRSSQRGKDFANYVLAMETLGMSAVLLKNTSQAQKYALKYGNQTPSRIGMTKYTVVDPNKKMKFSNRRKAIKYMNYVDY